MEGRSWDSRKVRIWGRVTKKLVLKDCQCLRFLTRGPSTRPVGRTCRWRGCGDERSEPC